MSRLSGPGCLTTSVKLTTHTQLPLRTAVRALVLALLLAGCQLQPTPLGSSELEGLSADLEELNTLVTATRADLQELSESQSSELGSVNRRLKAIDGGVDKVPGLIESACQRPSTTEPQCDGETVQTVLMAHDKMVVGAIEHVWISPPGIALTSRIDTGTANNSIHATDITPFERDGEDWVRFRLWTTPGEGADAATDADETETIELERKLVRLMRSSKRPVVRLQVRLGNLFDSFEFILTDRSGQAQTVELGRTFLQDVALVDVAREFVQPRFNNSKKAAESLSASSR